MRNFVVSSLAAGAFSLALCGAAIAQETTTTTITKTPTTVTKTVQHPDGSYTVIEYPVGKETIVTLDPVALKGAAGTATILRDDNGTRIKINMTGVPKEVTSVNLFAIDPTGAITPLGPVLLADGMGSFAGTTPLSKFMIVASPEGTLTTYDPTAVLFRSAVPTGFSVIPHKMSPVGEKVGDTPATTVTPVTTEATAVTTVTKETTPVTAVTTVTKEATPVTAVTTVTKEATPATTVTTVTKEATPVTTEATPVTTTTTATTTAYTVPMLNIPAYKKGDDTKMKINFSGALTGTRANVFITPRKDGPTEVKLRFHELKEAPAGHTFTVWAVSPDNKFVKLGQVVNTAGRNEAEIKSEIALPDFGLFVTMEDAKATLTNPLGPSIGFVEIVK